ncbi:hypothetical protein B0H66DRAFT_306995 [Apodospora peruviana]|uniref:Uncharacterized protein n=1 Tax=Apodospora peruviana TaxID=516989 RepID=A0AAE0I1Q3_9PEZI|nr:hypothetical protein B0H66DRAFT_306995 [Apodospora peruviana]
MKGILTSFNHDQGLAKNANPNDINGISCVLGTADEELYNPPRLHFYGNLEDTIIFCQFISWIAAVFRLPVENQLSASSVDFSLDSARTLGNKPPDTHKASFRITTSLNDLQKVGDQEVGTCWTPLFPSMVMASGFPVPTTPGTKGLLIPFGQMLEMADVLYDINLEDKDGKLSGVYFDGVSYVLYPTRYIAEENTVQWHLKRKREHGAERNQAHAPDLGSDQRWLRGVDLETLSNAKAVLGYCGDVVVQLGTASRLAQFEKYRYSLASAESPPPEISLTGLTASINLKGFANLGGSATARYPKGHRVARDKEKKKEYTEVLEDAERQWVILFETSPGQERAWMVSQLSLILELFNFWAFKRGLKDTIKFAEPGPSGVSEAKAVLDDGTYASTIVVPKKIPSDTGLCIGDIVKRIFNRIESRITEGAGSSKGESDKGKIRLGRGGIAGWDWLELAGAPSISDMRGIPDFPEPCWMPFTKRVPIFMGQNLGQLLTPKDQATAKLCGNWQPIPGGIKNNYLVASVASIQKLAEHSGHDECWFFSENLAWEFRDHHLFEGCRDECIANPRIAVQRARLQIKQHGAIVFATERKEGRW